MIINIPSELKAAKEEPTDLNSWTWSDADKNIEGRVIHYTLQSGVGLKIPHIFMGRSLTLEAYFDSADDVGDGTVIRLRIDKEGTFYTVFTGRVTSFNFQKQGGSYRYYIEASCLNARAGIDHAQFPTDDRQTVYISQLLAERGYAISMFNGTDDLFPTDVVPSVRRGFLGMYVRPNNGTPFIPGVTIGNVMKQISTDILQPSLIYEDGDGALVILDPIDLAIRPSDADVLDIRPTSVSKVTTVNRVGKQEYSDAYTQTTIYGSTYTVSQQARFSVTEGWNKVALSDVDDTAFTDNFGESGFWDYALRIYGDDQDGGVNGGIFADSDSTIAGFFYLFADENKDGDEWDHAFRLYRDGIGTQTERDIPYFATLTSPPAGTHSTGQPLKLKDGSDLFMGLTRMWSWNTYIAPTYHNGVDRVECSALANDDNQYLTPDTIDVGDVITVSDYDDGNTRLRVKRVRWRKRNDGIMVADIIADADCLAP